MQKLFHPSRGMVAVLALVAAAVPFFLYVVGAPQPILITTIIAMVQELLFQVGYLAACLLPGRVILRRVMPEKVNSAVGVVTAIALGLAIVGSATLACGLAGLLSATVGWGIIIGSAAVGLVDAKDLSASFSRGSARLRGWLKEPSNGGLFWVVAGCLLAIPVIGATLPAGLLWRPDDPHPYDSLIYHLQVPREWYEQGAITPLLHNVYSFFPFNVEMHYLLASLLRGSPWVAVNQNQFLSISFTLLTAAGLWGWLRGRVDARDARAASLAAIAFLCTPWVLMLACITYVESGMLLFAALAVIWFIEAVTATEKPYRQFVLAGVFAGLASGTKFTAVATVLMAVPAAAVVAYLWQAVRNGRAKPLVLGPAVFGVAGLLVLSPWLIRNQVWAGNPVFPNAARVLGKAHFSDVQVERFEKAHVAAPAHAGLAGRVGRITGEIAVNWRYSYVVFPLAVVGCIVAWRRPEAWMMLLLIVLMLIFWATATHLMGRFFILAVIPATVLIALLPRRAFYPAGVVVAAAAVFAWVGPTGEAAATRNLHALFAPQAEFGRMGLFALQDYTVLDEKIRSRMELAKLAVFVGDGQMFIHQFPMEKMRYRTVFDIDQAGRNVVDAYYGPPPQECPKDALIIVNPSEANRLSKTYHAVPGVEPADLERYPNVITVP